MILYFSGTGNSEYVAKRISRETGEECIDLFEKLKKKEEKYIWPWLCAIQRNSPYCHLL